MAITHDDLSIRKLRSADINSKLALFLVGLSVVCGLLGFIMCLFAEGSKSEVTWMVMNSQDGSRAYSCYFNRSGSIPLACSVAAFVLFAVAMFAEHAYMLVAITSPTTPPVLAGWAATHDPSSLQTSRDLTWQSCSLFLATWVCFAVAEVLLMIGIGVESGHLSNWTTPRASCHAIRPGLFAVAGVFGVITVFLGVALFVTALRTQRMHRDEENVRRRGGVPAAPHQHHLAPSAPGEPLAMVGAHQSQPPQDLNKTSASA